MSILDPENDAQVKNRLQQRSLQPSSVITSAWSSLIMGTTEFIAIKPAWQNSAFESILRHFSLHLSFCMLLVTEQLDFPHWMTLIEFILVLEFDHYLIHNWIFYYYWIKRAMSWSGYTFWLFCILQFFPIWKFLFIVWEVSFKEIILILLMISSSVKNTKQGFIE